MVSIQNIRPTVRAVIRKGDLVLVQVKQSDTGARYLTLPGGRQETGESMQECLRRECFEEIGTVPEVGENLPCCGCLPPRPAKVSSTERSAFFLFGADGLCAASRPRT